MSYRKITYDYWPLGGDLKLNLYVCPVCFACVDHGHRAQHTAYHEVG